MPELRSYELSAASGVCRRCGLQAELTVRETRYVRGWRDLLSRDFDAAATRTATCASCLTTYPVRSTDRTAVGAARRRDMGDEPSARDWRYPQVEDRRDPQRAGTSR